MPNKVLHIISGLSVGGAEMMLYKLLKQKSTQAIEHQVISLTSCGKVGKLIEDAGYSVVALGMGKNPAIIGKLIKLAMLIRRYKPTIIQGWMYHGNLMASFGRLFFRKARCYWNVRHTFYSLKQEKATTAKIIHASCWVSKNVDRIIYNSHESRKRHEALGYASKHGCVIGNGFDLEKYYYKAIDRESVFQALPIAESDFVVGHVARFHKMKDHLALIKAMRLLVDNKRPIKCVMIGRDVTHSNHDLTQAIADNGLADHVFLLGEELNLRAYMSAFDCLVLCSAWGEGFPNVIGEAMACQTPCVATDIGDSRHIIGDLGQVVQTGDIPALAQAIETTVQLDPDSREALGRQCRDKIQHEYTIKAISEQYGKLYTI